MTHVTPCASPENDPNDWFISRDGKQYSDDQILTAAELAELRERYQNDEPHVIEEAIAEFEEYRTKWNLIRRRHAVDLCFTECYFRLQCLDIALDDSNLAGHGTWGGYTEEQLKEIRRERDRRRKNNKLSRLI